MVRAFPVVVLNSGLPGCAGWEGDIGDDAPDEQAATVINTVPAATCHLRRPMIRGHRARWTAAGKPTRRQSDQSATRSHLCSL